MRIYLRNDSASKGLSALPPGCAKRGIILQVLGAGTAWYDTDRAPLENTDATGTPTSGGSITSGSGQVFFEQWNEDLWLRGSVIGIAVEITPLGVR